MPKPKIKLGDKVEDTITDLKGTITAITYYLNGCVQCAVQPKELVEGKVVEEAWVDETQLKLITPTKKKSAPKRMGGIRNHPKGR